MYLIRFICSIVIKRQLACILKTVIKDISNSDMYLICFICSIVIKNQFANILKTVIKDIRSASFSRYSYMYVSLSRSIVKREKCGQDSIRSFSREGKAATVSDERQVEENEP